MDEPESARPTASPGPRLMVALASVVAIGALAWVASPLMRSWSATRRARLAFETTMVCLQVDASSTVDEVRGRVIAAELVAKTWPASCESSLVELASASSVAKQLEVACDGSCCPNDAACAALDRLRVSAASLKQALAVGVGVPRESVAMRDIGVELGWNLPAAPPPTDSPKSIAWSAVRPAAPSPMSQVALCRMIDDRWWLMLHRAKAGTTLCEARWAKAELSCSEALPMMPSGDERFLIDGGLSARPHLQTEGADGWALVRSDGDPVLDLGSASTLATTTEAGVASVVRDGASFVVRVDGEETQRFESASSPLLFDGHVVAQVGDAIALGHLGSGRLEPVANLATATPMRWRSCWTAGITAVRARASDRSSDIMLVRHRGSDWVAHPLPHDTPPMAVSCHRSSAHVTWIENVGADDGEVDAVRGVHRVHDVACNSSGCTAATEDVTLHRHAIGSRFFVAGLGPEVALLWRSPHGDVRLRVAPLGELDSAPSIALVDDAAHHGVAWEERPIRLLTADGRALLLVDDGGVRAIAIDADGAHPL